MSYDKKVKVRIFKMESKRMLPEFVNREREIKELKELLSGRPNLVYFLYGPINSGKTALLTKVFEELFDDYRVFYVNFRGFEGGYKKFTRVFFELGDKGLWKEIKSNMPVIAAAVEYVEKIAKKVNTSIELPGEVIKMLQIDDDDSEKIDVFRYLEKLMERFVEKDKKPVFVLDEMQVLKDELNALGQPLLGRLFNFMIRLTKERHLCHCLCATSDCLFIENVYSNARLEGRSEFVLIDDLTKEEAFKVYEEFGFQDKESVWKWIGGKFGDMIRLFEKKKRGEGEKYALDRMFSDEIGKLKWIKWKKLIKLKNGDDRWEFLKKFKEKDDLNKIKIEIEDNFDNLLFWIEENVLFYNPVEGTVRPQSRLIQRAIEEIF